MNKILAAAIVVLIVCFAMSSCHATTVVSKSGHRASVSSVFAPRVQCFIGKLEHAGYRIDFMTGYAQRGNDSAHPTGNAIDINQTAFGRVTRRFPAGYVAMAASCGVYSGSHFGDVGHFEMPHKYGYVYVGGRHERTYARAGSSASYYYASAGLTSSGPGGSNFR